MPGVSVRSFIVKFTHIFLLSILITLIVRQTHVLVVAISLKKTLQSFVKTNNVHPHSPAWNGADEETLTLKMRLVVLMKLPCIITVVVRVNFSFQILQTRKRETFVCTSYLSATNGKKTRSSCKFIEIM